MSSTSKVLPFNNASDFNRILTEPCPNVSAIVLLLCEGSDFLHYTLFYVQRGN